MSFTRFNYDDARTNKNLQQATGPGRYILNTPGWGNTPSTFDDPQIRMQKWGGNLRKVYNSTAIDIHSDLIGITRPINSKDCQEKAFPFKGVTNSHNVSYPSIKNVITNESRVTHPAWMYRDLEQSRKYPLFLNPLENCMVPFSNNLNTRLLERDNFKPDIPNPHN